jgi:hypothetical protein
VSFISGRVKSLGGQGLQVFDGGRVGTSASRQELAGGWKWTFLVYFGIWTTITSVPGSGTA